MSDDFSEPAAKRGNHGVIRSTVLWLVVILVVLIGQTVYLSPPDSVYYFAVPRSLVLDGNLDFLDEVVDFHFPQNQVYLTEREMVANDWPIGSGLVWTPLYAVGHVVELIAPKSNDQPRGAGPWEKAITSLGIVALGIGGIALTWVMVRNLFGRIAAWWAVLVAVLGGPLFFYMLIFPLMSHVTSFAATALFLWGWNRTRGERSRAQWILLGLLMGWLVAIRPQNVVCAMVFVVEGIAILRGHERWIWMRRAALGAVASLLAFLPQMLLWWRLYGHPLQLPKIEEMHWLAPRLGAFLFSDYHGLLIWTPAMALAVVGAPMLIRRDHALGWGIVAVLVLQIYLNAANEVWWAGGSFSNRRFADVAAFVAVAMSPLFAQRGWRWGFGIIAALFTVWSMSLLWAERAGLVSLDRYVPISQMFQSVRDVLLHPIAHAPAMWGDFGGLALPARLVAIGLVAVMGLSIWGLVRFTPLRRFTLDRWASYAVALQVIVALGAAGALGRTQRAQLPEDLPPPPHHNASLWNSHYEYGFHCHLKHDFDEAERAFERAIELWPDYPQPHRYLGEIAFIRGDRDAAIAHMQRALEVDPQYETARQRLSYFLTHAPPFPGP